MITEKRFYLSAFFLVSITFHSILADAEEDLNALMNFSICSFALNQDQKSFNPENEKFYNEILKRKLSVDDCRKELGLIPYPSQSIEQKSTAPENATQVTFSHKVQITKERDGSYSVPVKINDVITIYGIIDSGAAHVVIPSDVLKAMFRAKSISNYDFLNNTTQVLADGTEIPSKQFLIKKITIGDITVNNIIADEINIKGEVLLGQSFLEKLNKWSIDYKSHFLLIE